ncbi:MAG: hypothetical protein ABIS92_18230, partial [Polyangia bacterium]
MMKDPAKKVTRSVTIFLALAAGTAALVARAATSHAAPESAAVPAAPKAAATVPKPGAKGAPLRIAFSDWPGWTAFEIGIEKGWFKDAGVDVEFSWFEYT